jgi:hypothetical protein
VAYQYLEIKLFLTCPAKFNDEITFQIKIYFIKSYFLDYFMQNFLSR